jgi:hypothetical protein
MLLFWEANECTTAAERERERDLLVQDSSGSLYTDSCCTMWWMVGIVIVNYGV